MMKNKKSFSWRGFLSCIGFIALFLAILTPLTMVYVPKWKGLDGELMRSFYTNEENTVDVLMIGSCNMYSSYSPIVAYEEYGISSAVFACPDQEYVTAYHYLLEALKTQDIKVVALEALFLTCEPTAKREYYNRTGVEYLPASLNKADLILSLGAYEAEHMQTVDSTAPDKLLTYAGYFFPLLRYHGREDLSFEDITFHINRNDHKANRGGSALYSYLNNTTLDFASKVNGSEIRDISREYFIKIQELCEEKGISFILVQSPNHYRWPEASSKAVRAFAEERQVDFLNMHSYDNFLITDYSTTTGRLNVYGMKKFTEYMCEYIQKNYSYNPSVQTVTSLASWEEDIAAFHKQANNKGMSIDPGKLYKLYNEENGIRLLWNHCPGSTTYSVFRSEFGQNDFTEIATTTEPIYLDENVAPKQIYTYRIIPKDGSMAGTYANELDYAFVETPNSIHAEMVGDSVKILWNASESATNYKIQKKPHINLNYENLDETEDTMYWDSDYTSGTTYDYSIQAVYTVDDRSFYSSSAVISCLPLSAPQITSLSASEGTNTILWESSLKKGFFEIYRRSSNERDFVLYDTIESNSYSYEDSNVEVGVEYFYKIVSVHSSYKIDGASNESNTVGVIAK